MGGGHIDVPKGDREVWGGHTGVPKGDRRVLGGTGLAMRAMRDTGDPMGTSGSPQGLR